MPRLCAGILHCRHRLSVKLSRYPEVSDWRGFSWVVGTMDNQVRVLGLSADASMVRVELWSQRGKPREWWAIALPVFQGLAKAIEGQPRRPSGSVVKSDGEKLSAQVGLFGGSR